jgi:signal transduction histidine kinase/ActR/RegA family two-component response regulator
VKATASSLLEMYEAELLLYAEAPDEAGLLRGYEIGRQAADTGIGFLQLSEAHHRGLSRIVHALTTAGSPSRECVLRVGRSAEFFAESLASFEMVYQGYRAQISILEEQERRLILAREDADRANLAKSEFLSGMSHELRTPLNAILGFGQLLETDELDMEQRRFVGHIRTAGSYLLDLINEVLDTARIESGHLDLMMESVSVAHVIRDVVDLTSALAHAEGVTLRGAPTSRYVLADSQRLKQILVNLVTNAIKYNRKHGLVEISCEPRPEQIARIAVTDTGHGVAQSAIERLFLPFDRLGADRSDIEGTGLGLAMVERIAVAMGSEIGVESIEGEGSTFWIDLAETPAPAPSETLAFRTVGTAHDGSTSQVILYIEDNPANAELMQRIFAPTPSTTVLVALRGVEGIALAQQHRPDLVLLDLDLPDISGEEVLRQLRADFRTSAIPVVIVTADAMPARGEQLLSLGAAAYVTKPFDIRGLLDVVDATIAAAAR